MQDTVEIIWLRLTIYANLTYFLQIETGKHQYLVYMFHKTFRNEQEFARDNRVFAKFNYAYLRVILTVQNSISV